MKLNQFFLPYLVILFLQPSSSLWAAQAFSDFRILAVTPGRIFTPNGDGRNDSVTIRFQNPNGVSGVRGRIFDLRGSSVAEMKLTSADTLLWDGKDTDGNPVPKGIYIYQIEADGKILNGTVVVAR